MTPTIPETVRGSPKRMLGSGPHWTPQKAGALVKTTGVGTWKQSSRERCWRLKSQKALLRVTYSVQCLRKTAHEEHQSWPVCAPQGPARLGPALRRQPPRHQEEEDECSHLLVPHAGVEQLLCARLGQAQGNTGKQQTGKFLPQEPWKKTINHPRERALEGRRRAKLMRSSQ